MGMDMRGGDPITFNYMVPRIVGDQQQCRSNILLSHRFTV